jgi:hypothetical protein
MGSRMDSQILLPIAGTLLFYVSDHLVHSIIAILVPCRRSPEFEPDFRQFQRHDGNVYDTYSLGIAP